MAKVSIGLRGWRFEESAVFTDEGEMKPLDGMDPEVRERVARLSSLVGTPCNACWLLHGDENLQECNVAAVVYGEPLSEIVLCEAHEPDFEYWFREAGGREHRGEDTLQDAFFGWFADGGRAPETYEAVEHVDTDPEGVPDSPAPHDSDDSDDSNESTGASVEADGSDGENEADAVGDLRLGLGDLDFEEDE